MTPTERRVIAARHELKVWPEFWPAIADYTKSFEVRKDDRGFKVGDVLFLREWCPNKKTYSGAECERVITYIHNIFQQPGFVVMGIKACAALNGGKPR